MTNVSLRLSARVWAPITTVFGGQHPFVAYDLRDRIAEKTWDRLQSLFFFEALVFSMNDPLVQQIRQHINPAEVS